ncbi:hypothetical protein AB4K20DRAFT_1968836 [Rhizopus microsporus]
MQHILALSSVPLLKPARTHEDLNNRIDTNTCEALRRHILSEQQAVHLPFPASTRTQLEEIMDYHVMPLKTGPKETELITRHLEAILTVNLDNNIVFRWTSVSDEEKQATTRPTASINIIYGAFLSKRIGCSEVKSQLKAIFAFIVAGKYVTFYILNRAQTHLYIMCEIIHVQLPLTLDHLNKIAKVIACFQYTLNSGNHNHANDPATLSANMLYHAMDPKLSRKRKSITSHYSH